MARFNRNSGPLAKTARQSVRCSQGSWRFRKVHHHRQQKSSLWQVLKIEQNDMNDTEVLDRGHVRQENTAQSHHPDSGSPSDGISPGAKGSAAEKSETVRRRTAGKRATEDEVSVSSKKGRLKCAGRSLVSPSPEATSATDLELRLRRIGGRPTTSTVLTDGCCSPQGPRSANWLNV